MQIPYELILGWRYTRAGRATRRNGFISFISGVSMLGIALGVAALIIVLSVMNGFQKEVRDRMLGVVSHIEIYAQGGAALPDLEKTLAEVRANPNVVAAAPFIATQALLARGEDMKGTLVRGIDPVLEPGVTDLAVELKSTGLARLVPGELWRGAGDRPGAQPGRAGGRSGHADRPERPGDAGRRGAAPQADDRGRHLQLGPLRVRLGAGDDAPGRCCARSSGSKAPAACG